MEHRSSPQLLASDDPVTVDEARFMKDCLDEMLFGPRAFSDDDWKMDFGHSREDAVALQQKFGALLKEADIEAGRAPYPRN